MEQVMTKHLMKYLLVVSVFLPLLFADASAQDTKMKKFVIGSGGMVGEQNSQEITLSGTFGQVAIEKITNAPEGERYDLYQGFWTPDGIIGGTDVEFYPDNEQLSVTNYPNPFTTHTTVKYSLNETALLSLRIYDVEGNLIKVFNEETRTAGDIEYLWDATNMSGMEVGSGSYVYELIVKPLGFGAETYSLRNIMVLAK